MASALRFLKTLFTNRFGIIGIVFNLGLLLIGMFQRGFGYRGFHLYYEPLPIQLFVLLNFGPILLADAISQYHYPTVGMSSSMNWIGNFQFTVSVIFSVLQWIFIGGILAFSSKSNKLSAK